jgi:hypothetical protein
VPTFSKDVAPILYSNCVSCHRTGEVAPFTLTSYEDAHKRAKTIAKVTEQRFMPPWKAEKGHGEFLGERRLTDDQIKTLRVWADGGAPEGDPKETPALPKFAEGWQLGQPDMIVEMPETYTLRAEGRDVYRCFVLPLNLKEDQYVEAVEFRPGNRKVVHHALFFLDTTGKARELDADDEGVGYSMMGGVGFVPTGGLGGWAPGYTPRRLPAGIARRVEKGSDLVLQVHFHPSGMEEQERSTIGLYFAKKSPEKLLVTFPRAIRRIDIGPGETNYTIEQENELPLKADVIGIIPHAHLLCKEIKVDATLPDGKPLPLIWIKDWDFNWQDQYQYKDVLHIPAGTKVKMKFRYDNSDQNPAQPSDPPRRVRWGEQTTDEMAIIFYQVLIDPMMEETFRTMLTGRGNIGRNPGQSSPLSKWLVERFDKNKDGKLDRDERKEAVESFQGRREKD